MVVVLGVLLVLGGCGGARATSSPNGPRGVAGEGDDPAGELQALEERLVGAAHVSLTAHITSTGAVATEFDGTLSLAAQRRLVVAFAGTFGGQPAQANYDVARAAVAVEEGILIGLTRMGLLHNLAVIASGDGPSGADGKVRQWVTVAHVARGASDKIDGRPARSITFGIVVAGAPVGEAVLWLDEQTGLPVRRTQTVHFPEGDMQVEERYSRFEVR